MKFRQEVKTYEDLNEAERAEFGVVYNAFVTKNYSLKDDWRTVIAENLVYKEPNLVNLDRVCRKKKKFISKKI